MSEPAGAAPVVDVIAHRGASLLHPENSAAALGAAAPAGANWVEFDVRLLADGATAIHHDPHLADGRLLAEMGASELPDGVLDLDGALDATPLAANIEIKNAPAQPGFDPSAAVANRVVELLVARFERGRDSGRRLLLSSFDRPTLGVLRRAAADADLELDTAQLVDRWAPPAELVAGIVADGHRAVHPRWDLATPGLVGAAHDAGLAVNVWTVDEPAEIARLIGLGVDGIVTNDPAAVSRLFGAGPSTARRVRG